MSKYSQQVNMFLTAYQQSGQKQYFDKLYDFTAGHLILIARSYLSDKNLAEDVILEAFTRVHLHIQSFDPLQDGYNWMCKIVQNVAFTFNAKDKRMAEAEKKFASNLDAPIYEIDISDLEFLETIDDLPHTDKSVVYKRFVLDHSVEKIAGSLSVSKPAISTRLKRIYKKLKNSKQIKP